MQDLALQESNEDYSRSSAHAMGYLLSIAALPVLASSLPWRRGILVAALLFVVVVLLRQFLVISVRSALTRGRAKAVINWVDRAAVFIGLASLSSVYAYEALGKADAWGYCLAAWALAALGCSAHGLVKASKTWDSSTFVSSFLFRPDDADSKSRKV
jgi:predicted membrane channel-forming protein YqfA (hemolysin III family)